MKKMILASVFAITVASAGVLAAVNYDPDLGGFAGKGDVKTALGMSEAQIRAAAEDLTFTYVDTVEYDVPCKKDNASQTLRNTFNRERSVDASVAYDTRKNANDILTGFMLKPAGDADVSGQIACPGGWEADGDPVLVGSSGGTLHVNGAVLPITQ